MTTPLWTVTVGTHLLSGIVHFLLLPISSVQGLPDVTSPGIYRVWEDASKHRRWPDVLMLVQRRRRWSNIKTISDQSLVSAEILQIPMLRLDQQIRPDTSLKPVTVLYFHSFSDRLCLTLIHTPTVVRRSNKYVQTPSTHLELSRPRPILWLVVRTVRTGRWS